MKHIKRFEKNIFEMSVDKDWFKKNPKNKLSKISNFKNLKSKDINKITFNKAQGITEVLYDGELVMVYKKLVKQVGFKGINISFQKIPSNHNQFHYKLSFSPHPSLTALVVGKLIKELDTTETIYFRFIDDNKHFLSSIFEHLKKYFPKDINNYNIIDDLIYYNTSDSIDNKRFKELRIRNLLKNLDINAFKLKSKPVGIETFYTIQLPDKIENEVNNYLTIYKSRRGSNISFTDVLVNKEAIITITNRGNFTTEDLPDYARGIGLGYKLYLKALHHHKYGKASLASNEALQIWKKLIQNDEFYHIILTNSTVGVILKDQKIQYVKNQFKVMIDEIKPKEIDADLKLLLNIN